MRPVGCAQSCPALEGNAGCERESVTRTAGQFSKGTRACFDPAEESRKGRCFATLRLRHANTEAASQSAPNRVVLYADDVIGRDKFFIYEIPIPWEFSQVSGKRRIKIALAYDPPTRHTRADYLGVEMSYRLIRGATLHHIQEHFRKRNAQNEGRHPEMAKRYNCKFDIGPRERQKSTLQVATFHILSNRGFDYGESYYLVIRCERKWFADEYAQQRFAVVVEMSHDQHVDLYERVRTRVSRERVRIGGL